MKNNTNQIPSILKNPSVTPIPLSKNKLSNIGYRTTIPAKDGGGTVTFEDNVNLEGAFSHIARVSSNYHAIIETIGNAEKLILEPHSSLTVIDLDNQLFDNPSDEVIEIDLIGETNL